MESRKIAKITYFQRSNRDTDVKNIHMDTKLGRGAGMDWEIGNLTHTHTHYV